MKTCLRVHDYYSASRILCIWARVAVWCILWYSMKASSVNAASNRLWQRHTFYMPHVLSHSGNATIANRILESQSNLNHPEWFGERITLSRALAFLSGVEGGKSMYSQEQDRGTPAIDPLPSRMHTSNTHVSFTVKAGGYNHGIDPNLIIGGDVDHPPGLLHNTENDEIRTFTQEMWNKGVSLEESVERLNLYDGVQPNEVMDNFLYGGTRKSHNGKDDQGTYEGSKAQDADKENVPNADKKCEKEQTVEKHVTNDGENPADSQEDENYVGDTSASDVPGYIAPPEFIDEQQYRMETDDVKEEYGGTETDDYDTMYSDDEHPTGIDEVNYSALSDNEVLLVTTLMQNKLDSPGGHEKVLQQLLAGDTGGFTEEECRQYFDKFVRIGEILMELNKTMGIQQLEFGWIPKIERSIRHFISDHGCQVSAIKWTEQSVIVSLKDNLTENKLSHLHDALLKFLRTGASDLACYGVNKLGLLMYTDAVGEQD